MSVVSKLASTEPVLLRSDEDGVTTLTLNRPPARNSLSTELMAALQDALDAIAGDKSVRVRHDEIMERPRPPVEKSR